MEKFDLYYKWLGIPPQVQSPNHYQLLGLQKFEDDVEIIDTAANRQMTYLQERSSASERKTAQRLIGEVSKARDCLLDAEQKAAYDGDLRDSEAGTMQAKRTWLLAIILGAVVLLLMVTLVGILFLRAPQVAIEGYVFEDQNKNGLHDPSDPGIDGRIVFVDLNRNGRRDLHEDALSAQTDATGHFQLAISPGKHQLRQLVVREDPYVPSAKKPFLEMDFIEGKNVRVNFANRKKVMIEGRVYEHRILPNGLPDLVQPGIQGRTVFVDLNNNERLDLAAESGQPGGEPYAVTNKAGRYQITFVPIELGEYKLWQQFEPKDQYKVGSGRPFVSITLDPHAKRAGIDFGNAVRDRSPTALPAKDKSGQRSKNEPPKKEPPPAVPAAPKEPEVAAKPDTGPDSKPNKGMPPAADNQPDPFAEVGRAFDLPVVSPQAKTDWKDAVPLARVILDRSDALRIELLGGQSGHGAEGTFSVSPPTDDQIGHWDLRYQADQSGPQTIAQIALDQQTLEFRWRPAAAELPAANSLRNCALVLRSDQHERRVGLRRPVGRLPIPLKLTKQAVRGQQFDTAINYPPDPNTLKMVFSLTSDDPLSHRFHPNRTIPSGGGQTTIVMGETGDRLKFRVDYQWTQSGAHLSVRPWFAPGKSTNRKEVAFNYKRIEQDQNQMSSRLSQAQKAVAKKREIEAKAQGKRSKEEEVLLTKINRQFQTSDLFRDLFEQKVDAARIDARLAEIAAFCRQHVEVLAIAERLNKGDTAHLEFCIVRMIEEEEFALVRTTGYPERPNENKIDAPEPAASKNNAASVGRRESPSDQRDVGLSPARTASAVATTPVGPMPTWQDNS